MAESPSTETPQRKLSPTLPEPPEVDLFCPECDYDLTGAPGSRCPWCGWRIDVDVLLAEVASRKSQGFRRFAAMGTCLVLAGVSLGAMGALLVRSRSLTLRDGFTVLAVFLAVAGHLTLAGAAALGKVRWPMRRGELTTLLDMMVGVSILAAIVGATSAMPFPPKRLTVEGVPANGVFEFFLSAAFFSLPGITLLMMRLVSFREHKPPRSGIGSSTDSEITASSGGRPPFWMEIGQCFTRDQMAQSWDSTPRRTTPSIEAAIARTWEAEAATARERDGLFFDGDLARLIRATATKASLHLALGPTTYRDFLGTNLHNPALTMREGPSYLAGALGISVMVQTSDGFLAFGKRSERVAYHAGCVHPFGGMVESADRRVDGSFDLFGCALRELFEETGACTEDVSDIVITGLVRDRTILQPELVFDVSLTLTRPQLQNRFDPLSGDREHTAIVWARDEPEELRSFLIHTPALTPVAHGALLLHGKRTWGTDWYDRTCYERYGELVPSFDGPVGPSPSDRHPSSTTG